MPSNSRLLRVLGLHGFIPWVLVRKTPTCTTWRLAFGGELEDFYEC